MVSFHTDTGLKPHSPLIDGPINECLPEVWPYINQVLFQLVDVACALLINMGLEDGTKFCNRPDRSGLLGGQTSGEMKSGVAWHKYSTVARARWPVRCNSTDIGLHECPGCHDNSCSWYSAVWIIFMVNYQEMLQEQFDQMALLLVDVRESYWP